MANVNFLLKRTATANKRPTAAQLAVGELAMNYAADDPGLFLEDNSGAVRKIGPTTVSGTAPNVSPAGQAGNSTGEMWLDTTDGGAALKVYDGSSWQTSSIPGITTATSGTAISIDSSNRVGIGTSSPSTLLHLSADGANSARMYLSQANATTDGVDITGYRSRGTIASPESLQASDTIFKLFAQGYDGSSFVSAGNMGWTASDGSGNSTFALKTRVGSSVADRLTINTSGNATLTGDLAVNGELTIGSVGSPFQASAANDAVTKSYADSTYATGYGIQAHAAWDASAGGSFDWSTDKISEGNITSVTRTATGKFTVTFDSDFSSANYTAVCTAGGLDHSGITAGGRTVSVLTRAAGSMDIVVERADDATNDDCEYISVMVIGTLA